MCLKCDVTFDLWVSPPAMTCNRFLVPTDVLPQGWYHSGGGRAVLRVPGGTRLAPVRWGGEDLVRVKI